MELVGPGPHFLELVRTSVGTSSNIGYPVVCKCNVMLILVGSDFLELILELVGTDFSIGYSVPNGIKKLNCFIVKLNKD